MDHDTTPHCLASLNQEIVVIWFELVLTAAAVDSHDVCVILI